MRLSRPRVAIGLGVTLLLLVAFLMIVLGQRTLMPFKCSGSTVYNLSRDNRELLLYLAQDLRFQTSRSGYLLLNGRAVSDGKTTVFNRTIHLGEGGQIDNDTFRYHIARIAVSPTDTTPDAIFDRLFAELSTDSANLQLDVVHIENQAYLIGGPVSFLFTCTAY